MVQTLTDSAVAIAASYAAKGFGIKTGTLMRDARQLCPAVIPVQANHRLYTEYCAFRSNVITDSGRS